ncbi:BREX protein BrxB domain-containing protein [Gemmatimonadota bacterium]
MSTQLLDERIRRLENRLVGHEPLGPSADIPFGVFVYEPADERELREQVRLLATRLGNEDERVCVIDLGELLWECLDAHPDGPDALAELEDFGSPFNKVLQEANRLVVGSKGVEDQYAPGPFEQRILDRVSCGEPAPTVVLLIRAGELFPIYRTSALLERLIGPLQIRTILFYPGTKSGSAQLRFMGVCAPSPNYRAEILD